MFTLSHTQLAAVGHLEVVAHRQTTHAATLDAVDHDPEVAQLHLGVWTRATHLGNGGRLEFYE